LGSKILTKIKVGWLIYRRAGKIERHWVESRITGNAHPKIKIRSVFPVMLDGRGVGKGKMKG
jgi:hypothetical protein